MEGNTYKAAVRHDKEGKDLRVTEYQKTEPGAGFVRVRVEAAPINPSDVYHAMGVYGGKGMPDPPSTIGLEGCGQIEAIGADVPADLLNKKVAFGRNPAADTLNGTWAQYAIVHHRGLLVFPDTADYSVIASSFVNPVTVVGLIDKGKKDGHTAFIHTAAASSLGKQLIKYCKKIGTPLVNIVRREEQVKQLKEIGAEYVLNSSDEKFQEELEKVIADVKPTALLEAVGGDTPMKIFLAMPNGSYMYPYGVLSGQPYTVSGATHIFEAKVISGFWLGLWLGSLAPEEAKTVLGEIV